MGDLRAASHHVSPHSLLHPLNAIMQPCCWRLAFAGCGCEPTKQTIVGKHTIVAGDASRHAENIGTSPPHVQTTLCPCCHAPATLMRASRCLTVVRLRPSPCNWYCKHHVEHCRHLERLEML